MRRSLGGGGGGMGGGNGGGSGMLRTVHRAVRAGVGGAAPEPFSPSSNSTTSTTRKKNTNFNKKKSNPPPNTALTLSSSTGVGCNGSSNSGSSAVSSLINFPVSAASGAAAPPTYSEDLVEWECVDESEDERARGFYEDFVFGAVPSSDEVNHAVYALQQVLGSEVTSPMSVNKSVESEMDWIEPSLHLCNSNMLQSCGSDRVYDAFHLLQTEPSVQRMVISLSSDKAVWDAILNNEFVKELRGSIQADEKVGERERSDESNGDSNPIKDMMSWIIVNAREKIMQLIDNITKLVTEAFQTGNEEKRGGKTDPLEEKLKTSLFLSIVVLLIVVVTRAQSAWL